MVTATDVRALALSFEGTEELPHFERTSFRVKKKIFATMDDKNKIVCVPLSLVDQSAFCAYDATVMYPVPNAWGKKGWTNINLQKVKKAMLRDAVTCAHTYVVAKSTKAKTPAKRKI